MMSDWIKCEEKLPKISKDVLVYALNKLNGPPIICITRLSDVSLINTELKTTPYWVNPFQYFTSNYTITHWMDLPEPPKDEICIGDEMCYIDNEDNKFVVTYLEHNSEYCQGIYDDGSVVDAKIKLLKKTGRHFNICDLLYEMREQKNDVD